MNPRYCCTLALNEAEAIADSGEFGAVNNTAFETDATLNTPSSTRNTGTTDDSGIRQTASRTATRESDTGTSTETAKSKPRPTQHHHDGEAGSDGGVSADNVRPATEEADIADIIYTHICLAISGIK